MPSADDTPRNDAWHCIPVVLTLSSVPESIHYRSYLEPIGDRTLLEWSIGRIRSYAGTRVTVLARPPEASRIEPLIAQERVDLAISKHQRDCDALRELVERRGWSEVACVNIEHAFAPETVLREMTEEHVAGACDLSFGVGLPMTASPILMNMDTLRPVLSLPVMRSLASPWQVCALLAKSRNRQTNGRPLRIGRYDVRRRQSINRSDVPYTLTIRTPADVALAREVISRDAAGEPVPLLASWRRAVFAGQRAASASLRAARSRSRRRAPKMPRRVLFVANPSALSGAEESLCQLVSHLDRTRYVGAGVMAFEGQFSKKLAAVADRLFCPNMDFATGSADAYDYVRRVVHEYQPDVIHSNTQNGRAVIVTARAAGVPLVQHVRVADVVGWDEHLKASSAIIAVSEFVRQEVLAHDVPPEKVHVVYNGVDVTRFYPGAVDRAWARATFGLDQKTFTLVMIGRFAPIKGHSRLFEAVAGLVGRGRELTLLCVGEAMPGDPGIASLERELEALEIAKHVTLVGFQEDTRIALAAADALVLCSEREPFARCVLEAMAMGVPVIVSEGGGIGEVLAPEKAGLLVPLRDIAGLETAIARLADDEQRRVTLGATGADVVRRRLTSSQNAEGIMRIYDQVLGAPLRAA